MHILRYFSLFFTLISISFHAFAQEKNELSSVPDQPELIKKPFIEFGFGISDAARRSDLEHSFGTAFYSDLGAGLSLTKNRTLSMGLIYGSHIFYHFIGNEEIEQANISEIKINASYSVFQLSDKFTIYPSFSIGIARLKYFVRPTPDYRTNAGNITVYFDERFFTREIIIRSGYHLKLDYGLQILYQRWLKFQFGFCHYRPVGSIEEDYAQEINDQGYIILIESPKLNLDHFTWSVHYRYNF